MADQEKESRRFCEQQGWTVAWVIRDDDISAGRTSKKKRPGYAEVWEHLANDSIDVLVAWESSRLQRDLAVYVRVRDLCEQFGVLWSYNGRVYDLSHVGDRFTTGLDALLDERYSGEISDRVLRAVRSRVETGKAHGRLPFGYRAVYDQFTGAPIGREPDPASAPIVKEIVRRVLAGDSNNSIAADLNQRGVPSPHAVRLARQGDTTTAPRPWTLNLVARVAKSASAAGIRLYRGKEEGEASWEPLISVQDHNDVLAKFADPSRLWIRDRTIKHLLTGIALCGVCGSPVRTMPKKHPQYACRDNYCVGRAKAPVEALVVETLLARLERPDAGELFTDSANQEEISAASAELAELEARLEGFRVSAEDPKGISVQTLARMEAKYLPMIEDARQRSIPAHVPTVVRDLVGAPDVRERWAELSVNQRRHVVRHLMVVTIMRTSSRGTHVFDPSCIKIEWL